MLHVVLHLLSQCTKDDESYGRVWCWRPRLLFLTLWLSGGKKVRHFRHFQLTTSQPRQLPVSLCVCQWRLAENMTTFLAPINHLTREISLRLATAADVMPSVTALKHLLGKAIEMGSGVRTARRITLEAVNNPFGSISSCRCTTLQQFWNKGINTAILYFYKYRYFDTVTKQEAIHNWSKWKSDQRRQRGSWN